MDYNKNIILEIGEKYKLQENQEIYVVFFRDKFMLKDSKNTLHSFSKTFFEHVELCEKSNGMGGSKFRLFLNSKHREYSKEIVFSDKEEAELWFSLFHQYL